MKKTNAGRKCEKGKPKFNRKKYLEIMGLKKESLLITGFVEKLSE